MDSPPVQAQSLEEIRREIDAIDDSILKLVAERLAMVDRVRAVKNDADNARASPMRPAREAAILRRIIDQVRRQDSSRAVFQAVAGADLDGDPASGRVARPWQHRSLHLGRRPGADPRVFRTRGSGRSSG